MKSLFLDSFHIFVQTGKNAKVKKTGEYMRMKEKMKENIWKIWNFQACEIAPAGVIYTLLALGGKEC